MQNKGRWYRKGKRPDKAKAMKRLNNLYQQICSVENLQLADKIARKGKDSHSEIVAFDLNREENIQLLHEALINKTYRTSGYTTFTIYEPKERIIYRLKSYLDRIVQHAIMNVLQKVFVAMFTTDTYSCIKGKGIHAALQALTKALKNTAETTYYLQLDINKFYPSVDHGILKQLLRRKFKDNDLLSLLVEIIDSAPGLPIGNYLSQYLANFYLTGFDHWIKEVKGVRYYFRYADDIVILANNKASLHKLRFEITQYLLEYLKLSVKPNYKVVPVACGINFLGYESRPGYIRLRKRIKQNFIRMMKFRRNPASIASYNGWIKHCHGRHLFKKYLKQTA